MAFRGHIRNGVAVIDEAVDLPDGTPVRIEVERVDSEFWSDRSVAELAREQGVRAGVDPGDLAGDWPADDSIDEFLRSIRRGRR